MSQLFSFLDTEVAKYRDIENILGKLKEEGEVQTIYDFFKNIFSNEFKFTMQELGRIENEKNEKLNIQEQCQENLSMFKSNFFLIVQMIFEKAFKSASVENKTKFAQKDGLTPAETTMESVNISTVSEERGSKKKKTKKARSKSRKADSEADLSTEVVKSKSKSKAKKNSSKFNNSSLRASSPLAKIFGSTTSTRANEDGERTSFFKERSSRKSSPHPNQQSRASLQSDLYVQSEFNHVRGPGTFKRSPRRMEHGTLSPGPAAYDVDKSSLRQSPSPTIDRAMRKSWVDEIVAQNEGPGPAQHYASHHVLSK